MAIRSTRQVGWFMCSAGRAMQHFTTDGGNSAVCNKRYQARYAPLNDGSGWGCEIHADLDPDSPLTPCPKCLVKASAGATS